MLPEVLRPQQWLTLLTRLGHPRKSRWNVRIMERYRHGAGVITYLARYLRGGPLKNARLVAWDGDRVTFTCRVRHEEADSAQPGLQQITLPAQFITATRGRKVDCLARRDQTCCSISSILRGCAGR